MGTPDVPAKFKALVPKALKGDAGYLEIVRFIRERIADQGALLECLRLFAGSYAASLKERAEGPRQAGLAVFYALLAHAVRLAGPMNELADFVLYIDALAIQSQTGAPPRLKFDLPKATTAPEFELYKTLWLKIPELPPERGPQQGQGRGDLRAQAMKARTRLRDARTLTSVLSDAYQKEWGRKPTRDELFDYDPAPKTSRKEFDQAVLACQVAHGQLSYYAKNPASLESRLRQLDQAFAALRKLLMAAGADPLAYYQMWKWARERVWGRSTPNMPENNAGSPHYEVYLEVCYCALFLARSPKWNMLQVQKSKVLPAADLDLLVGPLSPREQDHFKKRLELGLKNPAEDYVDFETLTGVRRRMEGYAREHGFHHLDEFETVDLMKKIIAARRNEPEVFKTRVIRAVSNYPALQDRFKLDQTVLDAFTIVWAEGTGRDEKVVVEFHTFSLQLFRLPADRLDYLIRNALWRKMQELGEQVRDFMLAYLEILGYVADFATGGMAGGGLRGVAAAFLKDQVKERGIDAVLGELGVDNPYLQMVAQMGSGAVHMPKGKVRVDAEDVRSTRRATGTDAITDAERGLAPKVDTPKVAPPTVGRTSHAPIVDFQKPPANDYAVNPAKPATKTPEAGVTDVNARRQQIAKRQEENAAQMFDLRKNQKNVVGLGGAGPIRMGPQKSGGDGPTVGHNAPTVAPATHTVINRVDPPPTGVPSNASRGTVSLPRPVPANSVDETVQRILRERNAPNPLGSRRRSVEAPPTILDAQSRSVLGETLDLRIAGTGGIDRITASTTRGGELTVKVEGVLLPDRLTRRPESVGGTTTMAPNFNGAGPSNQFRIEEMEIRGPKNEPVTMQRAHLWGPGFGDEAAAGMFLAPSKVNLEWQNQMAEGYLRDLATRAGAKGGFVRLEATATSWGKEVSLSVGKTGEKFLKQIKYDIELHMPGKPVRRASVTLNVPKPPVPDALMSQRHVRGAIGEVQGEDLTKYVR